MVLINVRGPLWMGEAAAFENVILNGAHIGGPVSMIGAKVTGTLHMEGASIGDLFMRGGAGFENVFLNHTHIEGVVSMIGAKVTGTLNMDGIIAVDLYIARAPSSRA